MTVNADMRASPGNGRGTLWLILFVCVMPFAGAYLLYHYAPPAEHMNYGELFAAHPLPDLAFRGADGKPVHLSGFRGKWLLLHVDGAQCDARCGDKLYKLRQVRLAQGKNMERVQRVWVITDEAPVDAKVLSEYEGTVMLRAAAGDVLPHLPARSDVRDHIWLIDPLGNLVLRYPPKADPSGIKNDLQRLLKVSRIG